MVRALTALAALFALVIVTDAHLHIGRGHSDRGLGHRDASRRYLSSAWAPDYSGGTYHPPSVQLGPVIPNLSCASPAYLKLTRLLPKILTNAVAITSHSWEFGATIQSLLEVYNPEYWSYGYQSNSWSIPDAAVKVALSCLYATNWTGAPSTLNTTGNIALFLDASTSPTPLQPAPLVPGDGALGDPANIGPSTYLLAQLSGRADFQRQYAVRPKEDYAWAVGNQLAHLNNGTKSDNGTISQREGYFELWADMGYMIPPFPACEFGQESQLTSDLGLATSQIERIKAGLKQWSLEASALYDPVEHLYRHVHYWDSRFWATGQAWMLGGAMRVIADAHSAGFADQLSDQIEPIQQQLGDVLKSVLGKLGSDGLVPNYMNDPNTTISVGDSSGTALIVASFYRYVTYFPGQMTQRQFTQADKAFTGVMNKTGEDGWVTHVVDPLGTNGFYVYPDLVPPVRSPEAQAFCGMMWAARTAAEE